MVLDSVELGDRGFLLVVLALAFVALMIASAVGVVFLAKWVATDGDGGLYLPLALVRLALAGFFSLWVLFWRPPLESAER